MRHTLFVREEYLLYVFRWFCFFPSSILLFVPHNTFHMQGLSAAESVENNVERIKLYLKKFKKNWVHFSKATNYCEYFPCGVMIKNLLIRNHFYIIPSCKRLLIRHYEFTNQVVWKIRRWMILWSYSKRVINMLMAHRNLNQYQSHNLR